MPDSAIQPFLARSAEAAAVIERYHYAEPAGPPRQVLADYLRTHQLGGGVALALAQVNRDIKTQVEQYGSLRRLPADTVQNVRNDMYLASETIHRITQDSRIPLTAAETAVLKTFRNDPDRATRYIPI